VLVPDNNDVSLAAGRITGALVGFLFNRGIVFRKGTGGWSLETYTALKYAALWLVNYYAAKFLVDFLEYGMSVEYWMALIMTGLALYLPSYLLQRYVVFRGKPDTSPQNPG
jgi:putative flippase GtrA